MRIYKVVDWVNIILLSGFTLYNLIYVTDVSNLKIWMAVLLFNCIIAIFAKMKFSQLAKDALTLAEINGELLKRAGKNLKKASIAIVGLKLKEMREGR